MSAWRSLVWTILLAIAAPLIACSNENGADEPLSASEVRGMIENSVQFGSHVSGVIAFLDQHSIEHSEYLERYKTVNAIIRNTATTSMVSRSIQMVFIFNESKQLTQLEIEEVYTGP
jgi:hypothetical protein